MGHPAEFLAQALDPPGTHGVARAMSILREVGACHQPGGSPTLTPLGHHLAALPVNVRIGKMLVYAAVFGCLEPMVRRKICNIEVRDIYIYIYIYIYEQFIHHP